MTYFGATITNKKVKRFTAKSKTKEDEPVNKKYKTNNKRIARDIEENNQEKMLLDPPLCSQYLIFLSANMLNATTRDKSPDECLI